MNAPTVSSASSPATNWAQLRAASGLVRYTILSDQIRTLAFTQAELYVKREA